jgi:phosphoribosylanthranilate isomerase
VHQRTRIKICGLKSEADVAAAVDAGADAVGFVLWGKSPRHVSAERAGELARTLPPFVTPVCLVVNAKPEDIVRAAEQVPRAVLQFHGDETPAHCEAAGRTYIRAARMRAGFSLLDFAHAYASASALLLDADVQGYGGGGKVFDWSLIPRNVPLPVVLSGGLHAGNVIEGILRVRPWAVDVSSGVEAAKGIKDAAAIRRFCDAVREADARIADAVA